MDLVAILSFFVGFKNSWKLNLILILRNAIFEEIGGMNVCSSEIVVIVIE